MATFSVDDFRKMFPAFADETLYPSANIELVHGVALAFVDERDSPCRILNGKQLELAINYMTAHLLTIQFGPASAANPGGDGGTSSDSGFVTSATIGDISVTKLAPPSADGWQYWLASSPYGVSLWALLELLAVGGMYIGGLPERAGYRKVGGTFN